MHRAGTWIKRSNIGYRAPSRTEALNHGGSVVFSVPGPAGDVRHVGAGCTQGVCGGVYRVYTGYVHGVLRCKRPESTFFTLLRTAFTPLLHSFDTVLTPFTPFSHLFSCFTLTPHRMFYIFYSQPRRHTGDIELVAVKHENSAERKTVRVRKAVKA